MRLKTHSIHYTVLALFMLAGGCIEPYDPDISRYEDVLVIDGSFSNISEDSYLTLSRSYGYYEFEGRFETGAVVILRNEAGLTATYEEIDEGLYWLPYGDMPAEVGKSYQLIIETSTGSHYETDYQTLKKPVEIDSILYEADEIPRVSDQPLRGLQVFLNSQDEEAETNYYRWDYTETWEFTVAYDKPGYENRHTCWKSNESTDILIANTLQLSEDQVYKKELNFISSENSRLSRLYSLQVRQYSLTAEAYDFWRKLELANEHSGSLFDPPPTPVTGNLQNTEDPYEPVLGYFQVAGASEKRIFISRSDLPPTVTPATGNEHCRSEVILGEGLDELQRGWYLLFRYEWMDTLWTTLSSHVDCYDCTQTGSNSKPDFWIDLDE